MNFRKYRDFEHGEFVLCFADTSAGGGDFCAAQFLSKTKLDVPLIYHKQIIATEMTPVLHNKLEEIYEKTGIPPVVAYERQNGGLFEMDRLDSLNRLQKYMIYQQQTGQGTVDSISSAKKLGWDTTSITRPKMLLDLKDAIDNKLITLYDRPTINELFSFVNKLMPSGKWKPLAETGAHDDLVMSLAGVWQMYQTEEPIITETLVEDEDLSFLEV